jgi:anti-sigma regulatory factor (Ser/Thr protein kinase)
VGDGREELVVWLLRNDTAFVDIRTTDDQRVTRFPALTTDEHTNLDNIGRWDCPGFLIDSRDLDGDGQNDLIFLVRTGHAGSPRGLFAFRFPDGAILWQEKMVAFPTASLATDLEGDGLPEYVLGTDTPQNLRAPINGTKDDVAYLMVFDHDGKRLFRKELAAKGTFVRTYQFREHAQGTARCAVLCNRVQKEAQVLPSDLFEMEFPQLALRRLLPPPPFSRSAFTIADLDEDGISEALLVAEDSRAQLYRYSVDKRVFVPQLERKVPVQGIDGAAGVACYDLNLDGTKEVVCETLRGFVVLDARLRLLGADAGLGGPLLIRRGKEKPLLVANRRDREGSLLLRFEPTPHLWWNCAAIVAPPLAVVVVLGLLTWHFLLSLSAYCSLPVLSPTANWVRLDRHLRPREWSGALAERVNRSTTSISLGDLLPPSAVQYVQGWLRVHGAHSAESVQELELPDRTHGLFIFEWYPRPGLTLSGGGVLLWRQLPVSAPFRSGEWLKLTRGMVHDLNNPLSAALTLLGRLRRELQPTVQNQDQCQEHLGEMENQVVQARNTALRLPSLMDLASHKPRPCDVNALVEEVCKQFRGEVGPEVLFHLNAGKDLPLVHVAHDALRMALRNVIQNAVEAVGKRGNIFLTTYRESRQRPESSQWEEWIVIEVLDDGPGIPPDLLGRLFEPGVTTKPGGSGVGLAITKEIMQSLQGDVRVECPGGHGTSVTLSIPVRHPPA